MRQQNSKGAIKFRHPLRFVYIEWVDAVRNRHEWMTPDEVKDWAEVRHALIHEGGFEIENTEDHIVLVSAYSPDNEYAEEQVNGITKIPKTWIRKRLVLFEITASGQVKRHEQRRKRRKRRTARTAVHRVSRKVPSRKGS